MFSYKKGITFTGQSPDTRRNSTSRLSLKVFCLLITAGLLHACSSTAPETTEPLTDSIRESSSLGSRIFKSRRAPKSIAVPAQPVIVDTAPDDVWERIRAGMGFALDYDNEIIYEQLALYAGNQDFILRVSERASPFLYSIVEEIERRELPLELALLPVVESAFDPFARSGQNAVGLWQFMSPTARSLGLKQDWWYDGRRDPMASTVAALDYLEALYKQFDNDWLLALAAYNAGQGTVQRAIRRNKRNALPVDFWSLPLPRETREHIPRLLGMARIVADPARYDIELPRIANEPAVVSVSLDRQLDIALAAQLAGLEPEVIYQLNPGFTQWATHPDGPHALLVPAGHAERFTLSLAELDPAQAVTWDRYVIKSGDTLGRIARQFRTEVEVLQSVNGLKNSRIIAGESLLIPRAYRGSPLSAPNAPAYMNAVMTTPAGAVMPARAQIVRHLVRRGDTLFEIARRYSVTVDEITRWNKISKNTTIYPGQQLNIQIPQSEASLD